jgi:hypothetical protein
MEDFRAAPLTLRGEPRGIGPPTLTVSHQGREDFTDLGSYPQLYILISAMGIASYGGKGSADIILMR